MSNEVSKIVVSSHQLKLPEGIITLRISRPDTLKKEFPGVIFLGGFPGYQRNLDVAIELSLHGIATLTFDYPGAWKSSGKFYPLVGVKIMDKVRDFFMSKLSNNITKWGIFGHSWGATLALIYAAQDHTCKSIAVLAPVNNLLSITGGDRASVAKMFIEDAKPLNIGVDVEQLEKDLDVVARSSILGKYIDKVNQPVLLIHGSDDQIVPLTQSEEILKLSNKRFKLQILEKEGHTPKNREKLFRVLLDWFKVTLSK